MSSVPRASGVGQELCTEGLDNTAANPMDLAR